MPGSEQRILPWDVEAESSVKVTRRTFLKIAVGGGVAATGAFLVRGALTGSGGIPRSSSSCGEYDLDCIASHLVSGGPPKDGIPAINNPVFITSEQAEANKWIDDGSIVDAIVDETGARAYPRSITVWHEIVNDKINGLPASLTFCPLTGSAVIFRGKASNGSALTFGTTGRLYNSNLVMYDRQTESMYPQILGVGISGPNKDAELEQIPVTTTTWARWKALHPSSMVLSRDTGHVRNYNVYPYGDYDSNRSVFFPVGYESSLFHPKKLAIGTRIGGESLAVVKDDLRQQMAVNGVLADQPIVALYNSSLDHARVFSRVVEGETHSFTYNNSEIQDSETGTVWDASGTAVRGNLSGTRLQQLPSFQVMWFAWYAFHPSTRVVP